MNHDSTPLLIDHLADRIIRFFRRYYVPFLTSFIVGLLAYLLFFTNKLVNFDDAYCVFSRGGTLESGRWGLFFIWRFLPNLSMPWLHGILTLVLLSVSSCVIVFSLRLEKRTVQALVSGLFVVFPTITGFLTYMFDASAYACSLLFAVVSFYLVSCAAGLIEPEHQTRWSRILRYIAAVGFCVISLSIYQAFFPLISSLLLVLLLSEFLFTEKSFLQIVGEGLALLAFLVLSFVVYYLILRLFWYHYSITAGSYFNKMTDTGDASFFELIQSAYSLVPNTVFRGTYGLVSTKLSKVAHILLFLYLVFSFLSAIIRRKNLFAIIGSFCIAAILPISVGLMLMISGSNAHSLVFLSYTAYYYLAGLFLDQQLKMPEVRIPSQILTNVVSIAMAALIVSGIFVGNSASLRLYMTYENSYAFYCSLATQIKLCPDLKPDSKLAIVGKTDVFVNEFSQFPASDGIMGATGFRVNDYSYNRFLKNFIGFDIDFVSDEQLVELTSSALFCEMPSYPSQGYIREIDGVIVVKLSDPVE